MVELTARQNSHKASKRDTADYEKYPGSWCSENGLSYKALSSDEMVVLTARRDSDKASEIV